jgi:Arc/MetJ family transcription regulator
MMQSNEKHNTVGSTGMRTTVTIDDRLYEKAVALRIQDGRVKTSQLVNEALAALVRQEAASNLSEFRGAAPSLVQPVRNRR